MKKQALLLSLLAALTSVSAFASNNTYVGGTLAVQDVTVEPSAFRGLRGGAFIGYGMSDDKDFYVAGELSASIVGTLSNFYLTKDNNLRMSPTLGLSVIPGMFLTQASMAYARVGLLESMFTGNNTWRAGMVLGLGLEAALSSCWSVRAEYDYSFYRQVDIGTPRSDEFGLSFKYIFDA